MPHNRPINVGGFMQIGVPKETWPGEVRAAIVPANASKLIKQGFTVAVQSGIGDASGYADADYAEAGASVSERSRRIY